MAGFRHFIHQTVDSISSSTTGTARSSAHADSDREIERGGGRDLSDQTLEGYDPAMDPELRLRVTRTAVESIHESIREEDRRRTKRLHSKKPSLPRDPNSPLKPRRSIFSRATMRRKSSAATTSLPEPTSPTEAHFELGAEPRAQLERIRTQANAAAEAEESARRQDRQDGKGGEKTSGLLLGSRKRGKEKERRSVFVNLQGGATDPKGYERNKVRTSRYTLVTFLPKNLSEQFRRVANIYFLLLVVLQVFSIFGASSPQVAMLPLLAILCITGIKDGIEDSRRHSLDNGVNNSAVTRLGDWINVNRPMEQSSWWHAGSKASSGVSKGVRKLREKEGSYDVGFLYNSKAQESRATLPDATMGDVSFSDSITEGNESSYTIDVRHDYPPPSSRSRSVTLDSFAQSTSGRSTQSRKSDVVSYDHATPGTAKWERTLWKKLEVGDVVLLKEDDQIPADIIVLSTSDPEGVCFVETKNLDGETNLKPRRALKATMGISNEEDVEHARFWVDSEPPHANLYSYNAVLKYRSSGEKMGMERPIIEGKGLENGSEQQEPITINELLLRGCALRNTKWVIGLVVYTGADTKIMLNQGETPSKRSKIEKETTFNVLVNFMVLMALCTGCAIADGVYSSGVRSSADYYEAGSNVSPIATIDGLVTFGASLILFQNIVPISLVITVELVKTIQAFFIYQDRDMYYEPLDHPCLPKTWNISDDLGQIEYVFSDKTGTLTQNVMEFQKCAVGGVAYGEGITEAMLGAAKREGKDTSAFDPAQNIGRLTERKEEMISNMKSHFKNRYLRENKLTLISPPFIEDLTARSEQQTQLIDFWRALALCHTVLADRSDSDNPDVVEYKAESPDEAALVAAARDVGFVFLNRTNREIEIEVMGQVERYVPLRVLEFNSSRKRMSTLVRTPDNRILLICKGADSVIYQRLREDHDQELIASTTQNLEDFSNAGLRTLCISSKYVTEEEFSRWSKIYDKACASIEDREDEIERACELIEGGLTILGATALEDKLQEGVPEAIAQLHKAGLKLWILTGDKLQTAIEIGFSCNLLSNKMEIMIISTDSAAGTRAQIEAGLEKVNQARSRSSEADDKEHKSGGFAVVIDGETLVYALDESLKAMFLELTTQCETVVCCRVSPSQKALTVKLVKDGKNAMTLAIGDGANDVAMIQEAHIGVGIAGLEGAQASMSADYAVGQFRFLTKLLLVHGRWCYIRVGDMHANFFYKNIVWTLTLFFYQIYCNFDATTFYDYSLIMLFNLIFTSLPVAVLGIFDQDVSAATSQAVPQLYRRGIKGLAYTRPMFFGYMFDGLYQSIIAFFIPYLVYTSSTSLSYTGHDFSVWEFGTTVAVCAVTAANLFVGLHIRYWTWMVFAIIIGSLVAIHVWICIYSQFPVFQFQNEATYLYSTLNFWTSVVLVQVTAIGPKFIWKYVQSAYFPIDSDIIREIEVTGIHSSRSMHFTSEEGGKESDLEAREGLQEEDPWKGNYESSPSSPEERHRNLDEGDTKYSRLEFGDLSLTRGESAFGSSSFIHGKSSAAPPEEVGDISMDNLFQITPSSSENKSLHLGAYDSPPEIMVTQSTPRGSMASSQYAREFNSGFNEEEEEEEQGPGGVEWNGYSMNPQEVGQGIGSHPSAGHAKDGTSGPTGMAS